MERRAPRRPWRRPLVWLAWICALVTLSGCLVTFVAFRHPLETEHTVTGMAISQRGHYTWTAVLNPNHLYDGSRASDEPTILTNITRALNMEFSYQMDAPGASDLRGDYAVDLVIRAGTDWTKRLPLVTSRAFSARGDTATFWTQFTLDIAALSRLIDQIEAETSIAGGDYVLSVQPSVTATVTGGLGDTDQTFAAPLELAWSRTDHQIAMPDQREFFSEIDLPVVTRLPAVLPVLGLNLPVSRTRGWAAAISGCALILTAWLGAHARRSRVEQAIDDWRLKCANARLFVEARGEMPLSLPTVGLRDLGQLVKLARETGKPIVHAAGGDTYYVIDGGVVYTSGEQQRISPRPYPAVVPRRQRRDSAAGL